MGEGVTARPAGPGLLELSGPPDLVRPAAARLVAGGGAAPGAVLWDGEAGLERHYLLELAGADRERSQRDRPG